MNNATALVLLLASLAVTGRAPASARPAPALDIVGVQVGGDFALRECPVAPIRNNYVTPRYEFPEVIRAALPCFKRIGGPARDFQLDTRAASVEVMLDDLPDGLMPDFIRVVLRDGRVAKISIGTAGQAVQENLLRLLSEKYGQPDRVEAPVLPARMAAPHPQIQAQWDFQDLRVRFVGWGYQSDMGQIEVFVPGLADAAETEQRGIQAVERKL